MISYTKQEAFDTAVKGLLLQGKPSHFPGFFQDLCCYRSPTGEKCAIGHLIPDDLYNPSLERSTPLGDEFKNVFKDTDLFFLTDMQLRLHDEYKRSHGNFKQWVKYQALGFAADNRLNTDVLND